MENIGQSQFLPVVAIGEGGAHKSLDQSYRNYTMPGQNTSNGCCRLCFKGNCHLQELFPGGYTEELLISKIFECTTVEITLANDPDALICYSCVAKVEEFHRYREQCRSNDVQYKNSKRRLGGKNLTAPTSTLIPAKYIKKEIDSEEFDLSAADFYPLDDAGQSYGALESALDGPTARIADSSGAVDSTIPNEDDVTNSEADEAGDENLLELMPEQTHDEFSVSYTDMNEEYENNNEVFCELPIKEEPQDIDDGTNDWNDYGMEDDNTMDHSTDLLPLIENCSYSTNSEDELEEQRPYREVYNGTDLVCLMQDGFLYVQGSKMQWHCRTKGCGAAVFRYEYSKGLETNGVSHAHSREVANTATDREILRLLKNASPASHESDDESFHYVKNMRKGSSLVYKGYKYNMKHKNVDGTTYWKCRLYKGSCRAALYQTAQNVFTTVGNHTHGKQDQTSTTPKPYVSSVSTGSDEPFGDKSSPGKIKLRIALAKTDQPNTPTPPKPSPADGGKNKLPIDQRDALGVIRRSYNYEKVKNANGRTRLLFDGNLYVWESSKKEGTGTVIKWRCRRNYDMCGVAALQYEDGLVEIFGDHDHSPVKNTMKIPDNCVGTTAYELLPTWKGGDALMLDGYRYVKAYNRPNGMSLWRCSGLTGMICRVRLILTKDGVAYVARNFEHDHEKPKDKKTKNRKSLQTTSPIKQSDFNRDDSVGKKVFRTGTASNSSTPSTIRSKTDKTMRKPIDNSGTVATSSAAGGQKAKLSSKLQSGHDFRITMNKKGYRCLIHQGYRYCMVRTRQDGTISWFCRMNKKTCRAGLYQYPDGRLEWVNSRRHNHSQSDPTPEPPKKIITPVKKKSYHMDDETFIGHEWYYVRNRKNGITLIHAGYRYHRKGVRNDSTSMWRCSRANQGCRAAIVMHADETIAKLDNIDHDHAPPTAIMEDEPIFSGDPDEIEQQSPNVSLSNNDTAAELSLVNFNGCIEEQDDPEANMRTLLSTMLDVSDEPANKSVDKIVISPAKANFKYVKNRRLTKSLVFRGYRYSRSSMQIRADGSMRWTCQMNKKTCRVSLKVLKDGSLELDAQKHNHPQLPEDIEDNCDNDEDDDDDDDAGNDANDTMQDETLDNDSTNQVDEMDREDDTAHDYYFALNRSNGTSLIFQHNRYSKENTRPDGSTVWRCMVRSDCTARAILHADGTCEVYRDGNHRHPPLDELPKPLKYADKCSSVSAQNLSVEKRTAVAKLAVKGDMLTYKDNRMKKIKCFADGTAVFKCAEVNGCTAIVKVQYEETDGGEFSQRVIFESGHNHPNVLTGTTATSCNNSSSTKTDGKSKRKSPIKMQRYSTTDSVERHGKKEYQLFKNNRGHVSLVYKGYRFSLRSLNQHGHSSWKCRANRTCSAHVTFTEDGRVVRAKNDVAVMPHNHPINGEFIERAVPLELDELTPPPRNLSQFVANWVNGLYKDELGGKTQSLLKSSPSHHHTDAKKTICHKNHSYKLQTIKNGREFWRCTMFKARACRAGLFCINNGTIIQYENGRQHNHEAIKPSITVQQNSSVRKTSSSTKGNIHGTDTKDVFHDASDTFGVANEVQKTVKRSHSSLNYDEQPVEESFAPAYQIVKKDGVDTLHYEKHRYVVIYRIREAETDESTSKRWRCCLWNSRHQCPVELSVLDTGEIHFETDPTHNHRPPPPESQEIDRFPVLSTKGTRKYELLGGQAMEIIFYKGYKFSWKEQGNGWTYYSCVCFHLYGCRVTVKLDTTGLLYECSNESHNHPSALLNDQSGTGLNRIKPLSERAIASKQARLANCSETGSADYRFVRSAVGNSMVFEGHRYWFHNNLSCGLHVYKCRYQKAKSCPGSVYMDVDTQLMYRRYDAQHTHEPVPEDALAAVSTSTSSVSGSCNRALPMPEQLDSSTKNDQSVTNVEEPRNLASDIARSELQTKVPKTEVENDDVITTQNFTFVKNYLNKIQLLYEEYVYEFVPLSYRKDSDKFYGCLFSDCSASVKLLPSGNLRVLKPNRHTHKRPDLTDCRDVGRGSADYTTLSPSGSGKKTKILFEGYQYYANVSQTFQDDTKVFHCYSNVMPKEKSKSNERCSVTLELLPNNRVIVTGTHHHASPKVADNDKKDSPQEKLTVLDGRSYRYLNTQPDGTRVWRCADDPNCKAEVYGKPNEKLLHGTTKHVLRHLMPKISNSSTSNSLVPSSSGNLRTKWYQGNRYNFYLTRRDGVQYWRCCKRIEEKCETGILVYPSGAIMSYNHLPHTHQPLNATSAESSSAEPSSSTYSSEMVRQFVPNEEAVDESGETKYSILNKNSVSNLFLTYNGVQYSLRKRNKDGVRFYRCRNKTCSHALVVTKRGKIIPKKTTWHSCENQSETNAAGLAAATKPTTNPFASGASGLGFDKPEIEDPDDLVDHHNSDTMEPILKRIRLDSTIELVKENNQSIASEAMKVDTFSPILNTETDAEVEEEPSEVSPEDMQGILDSLEAGNVATDEEYLEQEFEGTDGIDNEVGGGSEAKDLQPLDDDNDQDDDGTHDKQTIEEAFS